MMDYQKIKKLFSNFQLDKGLVTNIIFHSELKKHPLYEKYKIHIGEQRTRWLEEELANNEESVNLIITKKNEIIASKSFYQSLEDTFFDEIKKSIKTLNFLIEHKLVVNKQYQNQGYGTRLTVELNNLLLAFGVDYILGDTSNSDALRIYTKAGARIVDECRGYTRYFYKNNQ